VFDHLQKPRQMQTFDFPTLFFTFTLFLLQRSSVMKGEG